MAAARRRRHFFDGRDRLAVLVSSPSDLDDILPALVAYELEWNKLHELLDRDNALRRLVEHAATQGPESGDAARLGEALHLSEGEMDRLAIVWEGRTWQLLATVAEQRKKLAVRMLGGSWNDYERAVERWLDFVAEHVPPDLSQRPIYFVSSNMHSLSNLLSGSALARQADIIDYIRDSDSELLRAEYEGITSDRVRSSLENFLYYAAKKYLADPRNATAAAVFAAEEQAAGITTLRVPFGPDVDAQVIELSKLRPERIDGRLADLPALDRLASSDAVIVNIDYPLGQAGYFLQRSLARKVGALLGLYVMGKGVAWVTSCCATSSPTTPPARRTCSTTASTRRTSSAIWCMAPRSTISAPQACAGRSCRTGGSWIRCTARGTTWWRWKLGPTWKRSPS
jgi:hypothetical protein